MPAPEERARLEELEDPSAILPAIASELERDLADVTPRWICVSRAVALERTATEDAARWIWNGVAELRLRARTELAA